MKPCKYPITSAAHIEIQRAYMGQTGNGEVADLAKRLNLPRWKVTRYAVHQGWIAKQKKEPDWTDAEISTLEKWAHITPELIQLKLKAAGFSRSLHGIILKRKRMRMLSNLRGQSANSVALCLGVDRKFVTRAIKDGDLKAQRRGTSRTDSQGGDMWFIKDRDLRRFLIENVHAIDFRKVDKYWYTDIVAGIGID